MISVRSGINSSEIKQSAKYTLFVEGKSNEAIDPFVLKELLPNIKIEAMGPSYYIKSVAEALFPSHPEYFFLIDRDHYDDSEVEDTWRNFPDPGKNNLLIWRRKEFENYFLIPEFLSKSNFIKCSVDELTEKIRRLCQERLWLTVSNYTIIKLREELKKNWINIFSNPQDFSTKEDSINLLLKCPEFSDYSKKVKAATAEKHIKAIFDSYSNLFSLGKDTLHYGEGKWLEFIDGKKVLNQVVASRNFMVKDQSGAELSVNEKKKQIARDLIRNKSLPADFIELKRIITEKVR